MAKIFVDTNMFADFYESTSPANPLKILDELNDKRNTLVLVTQTHDEYRRNRTRWITRLIKDIPEKGILLPKTVLIAEREELNTIHTLQKEQDENLKELENYLKSLLNDDNDPVAKTLNSLFFDSSVTKFEIDEDLITRAHHRKLLGNPPNSPGKSTIGDEVIWEALLRNMQDDLIIVTRDKGFLDYESFLKEEFSKKTGKKLLSVKEKLSDAFSLIEIPPSDDLVTAEIASIVSSLGEPIFGFGRPIASVSTLAIICPNCASALPLNANVCQYCGILIDTHL